LYWKGVGTASSGVALQAIVNDGFGGNMNVVFHPANIQDRDGA
jgi:hypothetical protein